MLQNEFEARLGYMDKNKENVQNEKQKSKTSSLGGKKKKQLLSDV